MLPSKSGHPQVEFGDSVPIGELRRGDRTFEAIAALAGASCLEGERFFADCVAWLALTYDADYAFIATYCDESRSSLKTLAFCAHGESVENFDYDLAGSPCADALTHERVFVSSGSMQAYPGAAWLLDLRIDGYYAAALTAACLCSTFSVRVATSRTSKSSGSFSLGPMIS